MQYEFFFQKKEIRVSERVGDWERERELQRDIKRRNGTAKVSNMMIETIINTCAVSVFSKVKCIVSQPYVFTRKVLWRQLIACICDMREAPIRKSFLESFMYLLKLYKKNLSPIVYWTLWTMRERGNTNDKEKSTGHLLFGLCNRIQIDTLVAMLKWKRWSFPWYSAHIIRKIKLIIAHVYSDKCGNQSLTSMTIFELGPLFHWAIVQTNIRSLFLFLSEKKE